MFIVDVANLKVFNAYFPNTGLSDPYVIVYLQPHHVFPQTHFQKTQVIKKTLHPLFDETFELWVHVNMIQISNAPEFNTAKYMNRHI